MFEELDESLLLEIEGGSIIAAAGAIAAGVAIFKAGVEVGKECGKAFKKIFG